MSGVALSFERVSLINYLLGQEVCEILLKKRGGRDADPNLAHQSNCCGDSEIQWWWHGVSDAAAKATTSTLRTAAHLRFPASRR